MNNLLKNIMIEILEKEGFKVNPNKEFVENLLKKIEDNDGECLCPNGSKDKHCPCTWFREKDICKCRLYIKDD